MKLKNTFFQWMIFVSVLFFLKLVIPTQAFANHQSVLILHSYNEGLPWTDNIMAGMRSVLGSSDSKLEIYIEYMDTKRHPPEVSFGFLENLYREKFKSVLFDVILVSDNNALNFALAKRKILFPRVPIVFCGINSFTMDMLAGHTDVTGVTEEIDINGTIDLALRLNPGIKHIVAINDQTPTGQANRIKWERVLFERPRENVDYDLWDNLSVDDLKEKLAALKSDTVVLVFSFHRDKTGRWLSIPDFMKVISAACPVPILSFWDHYNNLGSMGGVLVDGQEQGRRCAEYGLDILNGKPVASIPILVKSPNVPVLDYRLLKQFKISQARVPDEATVLFKPESFLKKYRFLVITFGIVFLVLVVLLVILTFTVFKRKRAEDSLRKSQKRFLTVLNSIDASIYVSEFKTHEILFMNQHMIKAYGADLTGKICWKALQNRSGPCRQCKKEILIDENGVNAGVTTWQEKHPITHRWVVNRDRVIEWTDGRLVKLQISTDITEIKKLEEEIHQAHKMESIGVLAGGVAHDFNNILGIILGNAELAMDETQANHPARLHLQKIKTASYRARDVVMQLLRFSRRTEHDRQLLDIAPIIKDALKFIRSSIPSNIEIVDQVPDTCDTILADATQIHQIILNLCSNAADAMIDQEGEIQISVRRFLQTAGQEDETKKMDFGSYLELSIKDTGTGIDPEAREKMFEPYFTTKEIGKGTGMGLAVVHGIVSNHGGSIVVDSKPGQGTTVHIFFPVVDEKPFNSLTNQFQKQ
ncbi:MAG: ABC transporter substrate binding protein [Pseudomonadota bacterium]